MDGTLILNDDLMVLQRKGDFDIPDDYYEENFPNQFPNIRIDTEIFHFTGRDLRYSCVEYCLDSGAFVKTAGDTMTGDLDILVPVEGTSEGNPNLLLQGYQTSTNPCAVISFQNRARSSNRTQTIEAIASRNSSTEITHMKVGPVAITENGDILLNDLSNSGSRHSIGSYGGGALRHLTDTSWDPENNLIKPLEDESIRLSWDALGGSLLNSKGIQQLRWTEDALYLNTEDIAPMMTVKEDFVRYNGVISNGKDVVNKEYADQQDAKSIPLKGTRASAADLGYTLSQTEVDGVIDFANGSAFNVKGNQELPITYDNSPRITFGTKTKLNDVLDANDNKIENIPYPATVGTADNNHGIPKKYVDDQVSALQDLLNNAANLASPPGMINAFTGTTAPDGWLICDGNSEYEASICPLLHKALTGQTNRTGRYKTPDLRGRFLAQVGYGSGNSVRQLKSQSTAIPSNASYSDYYKTNYIQTGKHQHYIDEASIVQMFNLMFDESGERYNTTNDMSVSSWGDSSHNHSYYGYYSTSGGSGKNHSALDRPFTVASDEDNWKKSFFNTKDGKDRKLPQDWISGGSHKHSLKFTHNNNSNKNRSAIGVQEQNSIAIYRDQFDTYTRPESYIINWIIKYDNVVNAPLG